MKRRSKARSDGTQTDAQPAVSAKSRLIGLGAMVVVGLFGLLLAAQIVSPLSSAETPANTSCVSDEAAAKTASQLGFYETRPTGEAWETEALQDVSLELTASESAEVARGDNSWIDAHSIEDCFDLVSTITRERIIALDKWLTGRHLWKYDEIGMSGYWMPAAEAEEYVKRLNAFQTEQDEDKRQFEERRRQSERQAKQRDAQEAEQKAAKKVEKPVVDDPPYLRLDHRNTIMTATAIDDNLNPDSWQNAGPFGADPDCESGDLTYNPAGSDQYSLPLTAADNNQWYCFKVSDTGNNTGYVKYQVKGVFVEESADNTEVKNEVKNENNPNQNIVSNVVANNNGQDNNNGDNQQGTPQDNGDPQDDNTVRQQNQEDSVVLQTDPLLSNQVPQLDARQLGVNEEEPEDLQIATGSIDQGQGGQGGLPQTGDKDGNQWTQLGGYALIAGAILGTARILVVKKKHQNRF